MTQREEPLAVLFIDVSDSTGLYARRGDQEAYGLIATCLDLIESAVAQAGGRSIKRVGDEVLAVADTPMAGVRGALLARDAIAAWKSHNEGLLVRAGISYGPTVIADDDVHGDNVIVASRLVNLANSGEILLSDAVREGLSDEMKEATRPIVPVRLRGRPDESIVYRYIAPTADATRIGTRVRSTSKQRLMVTHAGESFVVDMHRRRIGIGRADDNEIVIHDDVVSRHHASIELIDDRYVLTDRSSNGTHLHTASGEHLQLVRTYATLIGAGEIYPGSLRLPVITYAVERD